MNEEFWLKFGFKENGELTCVRMLANSKPDEYFYYTDNEGCKPVKNSRVIRLTQETIEKLMEGK